MSENLVRLLEFIKQREGYDPKAYWDYGQYSIGYGTRARSPNEVIDRDEARRRLASEVQPVWNKVNKTYGSLSPGWRMALTSLGYNAGTGFIGNSGLHRALAAGNMPEAMRRFAMYTRAGGKHWPGLAKRRALELALIGHSNIEQKAPGFTASDLPEGTVLPQPSRGRADIEAALGLKTPETIAGTTWAPTVKSGFGPAMHEGWAMGMSNDEIMDKVAQLPTPSAPKGVGTQSLASAFVNLLGGK